MVSPNTTSPWDAKRGGGGMGGGGGGVVFPCHLPKSITYIWIPKHLISVSFVIFMKYIF